MLSTRQLTESSSMRPSTLTHVSRQRKSRTVSRTTSVSRRRMKTVSRSGARVSRVVCPTVLAAASSRRMRMPASAMRRASAARSCSNSATRSRRACVSTLRASSSERMRSLSAARAVWFWTRRRFSSR